MTSVPPTFSSPVIVREAALDRTKSPKYALSDMQGLYKSVQWSNMAVSTNGSSGTSSMNNTQTFPDSVLHCLSVSFRLWLQETFQYTVVNGTDKPLNRLNVYICNAPNSFVFINNDVKPLQLTIFKKVLVGVKLEDQVVVLIENLAVNQSHILHVDDNLDIYCTPL